MKKTLLLLTTVFTSLIFASCGDGSSDKKEQPDSSKTKKDTAKPKEEPRPATVNQRPPIINITDTVTLKRTVLYMKDSAATFDRISIKLGEIYGNKLGALLKKAGIKAAGQPMAWYSSMAKAPYFFEAGIPVDKKPAKLPAAVFVKEIPADSATVAHFYGPYSMLPEGYNAVKDILKSRKKKSAGKAYEIYIDDPIDKDGKMKDPYKVQTDIIFPWK